MRIKSHCKISKTDKIKLQREMLDLIAEFQYEQCKMTPEMKKYLRDARVSAEYFGIKTKWENK